MAGSRRLSELAASVQARAELPAGPMVVALSGGADSAVCAWLAVQSGRQVRAVHVDHGLAASPALRQAAGSIADRLELPLDVRTVTVPEGPSPEGQARAVRYAALLDALEADEWLLTGHTRNDQAETVLGNLLRGSGLDGVAGIPRQRGRILRPLLGVSRSETRELATLLGLPWRDDPTNEDVRIRRNAIRREVLPMLAERFNPQLETALARLAEAAATDIAYLELLAAEVPIRLGAEVRMPVGMLAAVPHPVARRAIRRSLRHFDGHPGTARDVDEVLRLVAGEVGRRDLGAGLVAERSGAEIVIRQPETRPLPAPLRWTLPGAGWFDGLRFEAWIETAAPSVFPMSPWTEVFDADEVGDVAIVRPPAPGDRIRISGGSKPLADVFAERGVPVDKRSRWPVVESEGAIIWVPGVRRADLGWVGRRSRRYLWVTTIREET